VSDYEKRLDELESRIEALPLPTWPPIPLADCGPHRGPEGPSEDIAQCWTCWSMSYAMRPERETWGHHLPDCSLPIRHESYCKPGGTGHPDAAVIRG
jgi:hypothetical protein